MIKNFIGLSIFTFIFFINSHSVIAQKVIYPHTVFWNKTEINQIFDNNWGVGLDFVYRRKNELNQGGPFKTPLRESIRPWIHYQFNSNSRLSISPIGYMNTNEYIGKIDDFDTPDYHEWRTTIQYLHHQKVANNKIMHTWRYRYEFRHQYQPSIDDYRYFTRFRFRYRLRYVLTGNDFYKDKTWYAAVSNEIGLNLGKNVTLNTFNQNRLYIGAGYRFLNAARVELRYVNRFRTRGATGFEFDNDQGVMLGIYIDQVSIFGSRRILPVRYSN
ncbi:DUF2490 domain-containing protein [Peijinzhouia sedimentorum]